MNDRSAGDRTVDWIGGLYDIAGRFDAVITDQYGVLHDGQAPFPGVLPALEALRNAGIPVVVLTNSGRRATDNTGRLERLGLSRRLFHGIVTSGETAWTLLKQKNEPPFDQLGKRCLLIARPGDTDMVEGLDLTLVDDAARADFILLAALDAARADSGGYLPVLETARARGVPLICTNPDFVGITPDGLATSPGTLARQYEGMGGTVVWIGKPHPLVFRQALSALVPVPPERVLMIGDSLDHDIVGGRAVGCRTLLIAAGILGADLMTDGSARGDWRRQLRDLAGEAGATPDWITAGLAWDGGAR